VGEIGKQCQCPLNVYSGSFIELFLSPAPLLLRCLPHHSHHSTLPPSPPPSFARLSSRNSLFVSGVCLAYTSSAFANSCVCSYRHVTRRLWASVLPRLPAGGSESAARMSCVQRAAGARSDPARPPVRQPCRWGKYIRMIWMHALVVAGGKWVCLFVPAAAEGCACRFVWVRRVVLTGLCGRGGLCFQVCVGGEGCVWGRRKDEPV